MGPRRCGAVACRAAGRCQVMSCNLRTRMTTKIAPCGPHTDQDARNRIDDWGLVVPDGIVVGAVTGRMEVMG